MSSVWTAKQSGTVPIIVILHRRRDAERLAAMVVGIVVFCRWYGVVVGIWHAT